MVPSHIMAVSQFPMTPNGKLAYNELPDPCFDSKVLKPSSLVEIKDDLVRSLCHLFAQVLHVSVVHPDEHYFKLGGDSITAMELIAEARQRHIIFSASDLFKYSTPRELAQCVRIREPRPSKPLAKGQVPLTPIQHWFFESNPVQPHASAQVVHWCANERLDSAVLKRALNAVLDHHDMSYASYQYHLGEWQQTLTERRSEVCYKCKTLDTLATLDKQLSTLILERAYSIDLNRSPLAAVLHITLTDTGQSHLIWAMHHLIVDGVSWRILKSDLERAYCQIKRRQPVDLPERTDSFQLWSQHVSDYFNTQNDQLAAAINYWKNQQRGAVKLPTDYETSLPITESDACDYHHVLSSSVSQALQSRTFKYKMQAWPVLLASFAELLGQWMGKTCVQLHVEGHGRELSDQGLDVSRTIGWFTSLYPLSIECTHSDDLVARVRTLLDELPERGLTYGMARYLTSAGRAALYQSESSTPSVSFNFLGHFDSTSEFNLFQETNQALYWVNAPENPRRHLIDVMLWIHLGQLHVSWHYSQAHFKVETIAHWATQYEQLLAQYLNQYMEKVEASDVQAIPLTSTQRGLLYQCLKSNQPGEYITQVTWHESRSIDTKRFQSAWRRLFQRHPALGASFEWEGLSEPVQQLTTGLNVRVPLIELDWLNKPKSEQDEQLACYLKDDRAKRFDLYLAPLMRLTVIRLSAEKTLIVWTHHHLLLDGWSISTVLNDLQQFYEEDEVWEAAKPYSTYVDYVQWERKSNQAQATVQSFWRDYLAEISPSYRVCEIQWEPINNDSETQASDVSNYSRMTLEWTQAESKHLRRWASEHRISLNTLFQTVWCYLLCRYADKDTWMTGVTLAQRPNELQGIKTLVGLCIKTVPYYFELKSGETVKQHLQRTQKLMLAIQTHSHVASNELQSCWSDEPLDGWFDSLFVFENYPLRLSTHVFDVEIIDQTHYALTWNVFPGEFIRCLATYDSKRVQTNWIKDFASRYRYLLNQFVTQLKQSLESIDWLTPQEYQQQSQWNMTQVSLPEKTVVDTILETCKRVPKQIAIRSEATVYTYSDVERLSRWVATHLVHCGVARGTRVGVYSQRQPNTILVLLGILRVGAVYTPLEPDYPLNRLVHMAEDLALKYIVFDKKSDVSLKQAVKNGGDSLEWLSIEALLARPIEKFNLLNLNMCVPTPDDLMYILYTSGTTGLPKGVCIKHRSVFNTLRSVFSRIGSKETDTWLGLTRLSFDISMLELWGPLMYGARVWVTDPERTHDRDYLREVLETQSIDVIQMTPSHWELLLSSGYCQGQGIIGLSGGETLTRSLAQKIIATGMTVWNMYGPTEASIWSSASNIKNVEELITLGVPLDNVTYYVLDHLGHLVPQGMPGELYIGGIGLAQGYHKQVDLTKQRFIQHPTWGRIYRTGDRVLQLPSGQLVYIGRLDRQIKIRGVRVELESVETCLVSHPAVQQARVVLLPKEIEQRLLACVVLKKNNVLTKSEAEKQLESYLTTQLLSVTLPEAWFFCDRLPLNAYEKVDDKRLISTYLNQHTPLKLRARACTLDTTPRLHLILKIFCLLLAQDCLTPDSNFFFSGGHSLLTFRLIDELNKLFQVHLTLRDLVDYPTPKKLAERIGSLPYEQQRTVTLTNPLVCLQPHGTKPPLFLIHPVGGTIFWFMSLTRYLPKDRPIYAIQDPGLENHTIPFQTFEEMAVFYRQHIQKVYSKGPYYLGGASFGATMAVEVAQQLKREGATIAFVGLLDGWALYPKTTTERHFVASLMEHQHHAMRKKIKFEQEETIKPYVDLHWQRAHLLSNYSLKPFDLPTVLFKSSETLDIFKDMDKLDNHWSDYCPSVTVLNVPGDHETMFYPPHVSYLAACLSDILRRVDLALKKDRSQLYVV